MSTIFTPEIREASVEVSTKPSITNRPPVGTRIRATLGENVIVGKMAEHQHDSTNYVMVTHDGEGYDGFRDVSLWFESGWVIEFDQSFEEADTAFLAALEEVAAVSAENARQEALVNA